MKSAVKDYLGFCKSNRFALRKQRLRAPADGNGEILAPPLPAAKIAEAKFARNAILPKSRSETKCARIDSYRRAG
ncbi:MAG: hypothetical protein DME38_14125 [Verrucomicrobia bacterium]|nr:MAG: hypothetical protein DME38_14125 [Verrucomicrobiota bacterium]